MGIAYRFISNTAPVHIVLSRVKEPKLKSTLDIEYERPPNCMVTLTSVPHGNCQYPSYPVDASISDEPGT